MIETAVRRESPASTGTVVALVALAAGYFMPGICLVLVGSLFVAILLEPIPAWGERRGIGRKWGTALAMLVFLVTFAGAVWGCWQPIAKIWVDMPQYSEKIRSLRSTLDRDLHRLERRIEPPETEPSGKEGPKVEVVGGESWGSFFWRKTGSFFQATGLMIFVPFLAFFALIEKDHLLRPLRLWFASATAADAFCVEAGRMVRGYFLGSLASGLGLALAQGFLFKGLGLENVVGLALMTGFANIVPFAGLPAAVFLPAAQGLLQFQTPMPFVILVLALTALHLFVTSVVVPRFIGFHLDLGSTAATLALLFWGWFWGVPGFLFALPLTVLIKMLCERFPGTRTFAFLLRKPVR